MACGECGYGASAARRDVHCSKVPQPRTWASSGAYAGSSYAAPPACRTSANVSSRAGALVEPLSVGLHGVNHSTIEPGMGVVVMGAGPIGLSTLIWAKARGASAVVVSELDPAHRACDETRRERSRQPDRERSRRRSQIDHRPPARNRLRMYRRQIDARRRHQHGRPPRPGRRHRRLPGGRQHFSAELRDEEVQINFALAYTRAEFQQTIDATSTAPSTRPR